MSSIAGTGRALRILVLAGVGNLIPLLGCSVPSTATATERNVDIRQYILVALKERRYADAVSATRRAGEDRAETDSAVGMLVLEGLSDPDAVQAPNESVSEALSLIEASALAGDPQAISTLASTFERGLKGGVNNSVLVDSDRRLSACWDEAKARPSQAAVCAAMRSGGVPIGR